MALKFDDIKYTRTDTLSFNVRDIVIDEHLNGRVTLPDITELKASIRAIGQRQAAGIRKVDGKPVLIYGFSRWRAILEINEENEANGIPGIPFLANYMPCDEKAGFVANLAENMMRNMLTRADLVAACQKLTTWNFTPEEIGVKLNKNAAWVEDMLNIGDATQELQTAFTSGRMEETTAKHLAKKKSEIQRKAVGSVAPGEKITSKAVAEVTGKKIAPTVKELRTKEQQLRDIVDAHRGNAESDDVKAFVAEIDGIFGWTA